jgi:hypothetical protein
VGTTFETRPTICVSLVNEGKTQVRSAIKIEWKVQRCVNANNVPPKGSPCHVLVLDEMIIFVLKNLQEYNEDGHT